MVRDVAAVAEVQVVEVLAQPCDGVDGSVRDVAAFREDQIAQAVRHLDDLIDRFVGDESAVGKVQNPERLKGFVRRKVQESIVGQEIAVRQPQFSKVLKIRE